MSRIDLKDYIFGDGTGVHIPATGETFRTLKIDNGYLQTRRTHYRHGWADDNFVYFGLDIADTKMVYVPTRNAYWGDPGAIYGRPWVRRYMSVGESFAQSAFVIHLDRDSGRRLNSPSNPAVEWKCMGTVTIHAAEQIVEWNNFTDVVRLERWSSFVGNGSPTKTYWYAKHIGRVGWANAEWAASDGKRGTLNVADRISEKRYNLVQIDWFDPEKVELIASAQPPAPEPVEEWQRVQVKQVGNGGFTNLRRKPDKDAALAGRLRVGNIIEQLFVDGKPKVTISEGLSWEHVRNTGSEETTYVGGWLVTGDVTEPEPEIPSGVVGSESRELAGLKAENALLRSELESVKVQLDAIQRQMPILRAYAVQHQMTGRGMVRALTQAMGLDPDAPEVKSELELLAGKSSA